jgi:Zn-dependent M28 family amino/carboxypeptidase
MINLDMVGRLNENKLNIGGIGTAAEWKSVVETLNSTIPPLLYNAAHSSVSSAVFVSSDGKIVKPVENTRFQLLLNPDGFGPSDHSSFYGKQIPVLFFFTGTHLDYHKPSDTADKINYSGEAKLVNYVASIAKSVDQNPARPTYAVAKSSNTGGRTTFSVSPRYDTELCGFGRRDGA